MMLVVDIGNTRLKWALAAGEQLSNLGSAAYAMGVDDAIDSLVGGLPQTVRGALVANVAGANLGSKLAAALQERANIRARFAAPAKEGFGIRCGYSDPSRLGVDRWAAMIGARRVVSGDFCVIQAGTAVTFDAVDAAGRHLGGLIFAGPQLMADALHENTGQIGPTAPALARPLGLAVLGNSTNAAVSHGSMLAIAAALDRAIATVAAETGTTPIILLTGGGASALLPWLEADVRSSAHLVLAGLAYMADRIGE